MPNHDWLPAPVRAAAVDRKLKAGAALFRGGDKSLGFFEVLSGQVRLTRMDPSGREAVLFVAGPGDTLAEASLFSPAYHCDAIAGSDAEVRRYPKATMLAAFEQDPKASQAFSAMLARQVMSLRTRLEQRNIRSARDRVRHYLSTEAGEGRTVELRGTLKDIAAELGLTHEALYRTLAALERGGELKRNRGKISLSRQGRNVISII